MYQPGDRRARVQSPSVPLCRPSVQSPSSRCRAMSGMRGPPLKMRQTAAPLHRLDKAASKGIGGNRGSLGASRHPVAPTILGR